MQRESRSECANTTRRAPTSRAWRARGRRPLALEMETPTSNSEQKVAMEQALGIGTAVAGGGISISGLVGLVTLFLWWPIDIRSGLVDAYMVLIGGLLILTAVVSLPGVSPSPLFEQLLSLFGFLRYWAGTGGLLLFAGLLTLSGPGTVGLVTGALALLWGILCISYYVWSSRPVWTNTHGIVHTANDPLIAPQPEASQGA